MDAPAPRRRSTLREYIEALLIAAIFLGFTNTFVVKTFFIPSGSMEETLLIGDHLFVNRLLYAPAPTAFERWLLPVRQPRRGDIVVFRSVEKPTVDLVKRCVGLPGDTIQIVDKRLFVNGERVEDDGYTLYRDQRIFPNRPSLPEEYRLRDQFGPFRVPDGEYFFLGDNRDRSYDSRYWGTVPGHFLKGRALVIYWSWAGGTPDGSSRSWGQRVRDLFHTVIGFLSETRWSRTFRPVR
ncbi:MAG: signal peptidase I [Acidobacteria bacterium]|jgi:signal peptidase I|nr:signal peptidase I [Thermoanaerobaculia bacterium]MDI9631154.1 signal peptidase I [Acidobacteriota bacterium]OQC34940.1 MAG: Signal peptidase I [Acidobacteria bacterium ADurb.Bin051]MBP7812409.1 signal peptidase I [Thermoanaerobaculia bacterium]MBP8844421.1 signal peptidase I [Thermoanaerobaculia bacterium]